MTDATTTVADTTTATTAPATGVAAALGDATTTTATTTTAIEAPKSVTIPGKDAKPEDWTKYFDDIGAPKTADAYELPVPEGQDGAFAKQAAGWMAEARLTPDQAKLLAGKWNESVAGLTATQKAAAEKAATDAATAKDAAVKRDEAALANEWGADAEKNKGIASRAYKEFFAPMAGDKLPQLVTAIEDTIGFAATMKMMQAIGAKIGEAEPRGLGSQSGGVQNNSEEARAARMYPSTAPK